MATATANKKKQKSETPNAHEISELVESRTLAVDRAAGVIKGVKILGYQSVNGGPGGREYSKAAVAKARGLYEGIRVNVDHPKKAGDPRGVSDRFGRLVNVREQVDGLYGDLEYLKAHPLAEMTVEAAERMPDQLGLSHNAEGRVVSRGGKQLVEEIIRVRSVDLVSDPATVRGLFEAKDHLMTLTTRAILEATFPTRLKLIEEVGAAMPMAAEVEVPAEASSDDQIKAAFRNAAMAAFDDEKLDSKATLKKIGEILKAYDKLTAKEASKPDGGGDGDKPKDTEEGRTVATDPTLAQLQEQLRQRDIRDEVRDLCEAANVKADPLQIKAACLLPTAEERKQFVEALKGNAAVSRPRSAGPLHPATPLTEGQAAKPSDAKSFAALCR